MRAPNKCTMVAINFLLGGSNYDDDIFSRHAFYQGIIYTNMCTMSHSTAVVDDDDLHFVYEEFPSRTLCLMSLFFYRLHHLQTIYQSRCIFLFLVITSIIILVREKGEFVCFDLFMSYMLGSSDYRD